MTRLEKFAAVLGAVCTVAGTIIYIRASMELAQLEREQIDHNHYVNLTAIARAHAIMQERLTNGWLPQTRDLLSDEFKNEIEFQKIALREE